MGLATALNTSLNGLALNETAIEILGNNIANAGTNGFKSSTVNFTTQLARTLSVGSAPQGANGGTNPRQVGLGAISAAVAKDLSQGAISGSTSPSDIAIEGAGFFVLEGNSGRSYSRNGNFSLNSNSLLVNDGGLRVQGYGVDDSFNLISTQLVDIAIPLGKLNVALETTEAALEGSLRTGSGAEVATQGAIILSDALVDTGDPLNPLITSLAAGTILLEDVALASDTSLTPLFTAGETLYFTPRKGGANYDEATFDIVQGQTTLQDFLTFLDETLGVEAVNAQDPAGVSITANGEIQVVSNRGESQAVAPFGVRLQQSQTSGGTVPVALGFTETQQATGESVVVTFPAYDSLGEQVVIRMHAVLESRDNTGTVYRYYFESSDDSDRDIFLGTGTIVLDGSGRITGDSDTEITISRENTAAQDMIVAIDFSNISGLTQDQGSELGSSNSARGTLNLLSQNGAPPGTLSSFNINEAGVISGVFTNGVIRTLGQIVLAQFSNPQGLVENGGGTFIEGVSSGPPQLVLPGDQGSGTVRSGAIELSNTDVGRNLVDLIVAATNYRGNARVISSVQQLVDELLVLGR